MLQIKPQPPQALTMLTQRLSKIKNAVLSILWILVLAGCEAPLEMDKVNSQQVKSEQRTDFYQSAAQNDQKITLVGNNGVILTSDKQADLQWQRTVLPGEPSLIAVDVCPDQSFIALSFDNQIWLSNDGAENWQAIDIPTQEQLMTLSCAPDGTWWVAGSFSTFMNSADKGNTWQSTSLEEDAIITNLAFLNSNEAIATAEYGMLIITPDGGQTWEVAGFLPNEFFPHAAHFVNLQEGWVGGLNGFIYHTKDSGVTWQQQTTDTSVPIYGFVEADNTLFALGDNATVLKNVAQQWLTIQQPSAPVYLRAGLPVSDSILAAGGRGMVLSVQTEQLPTELAEYNTND